MVNEPSLSYWGSTVGPYYTSPKIWACTFDYIALYDDVWINIYIYNADRVSSADPGQLTF